MIWKFDPEDNSTRNHIRFMYDDNIDFLRTDPELDLEIIRKPDCIPDSAVREGTYCIRQKGSYYEVEFYKGLWFQKGEWPNNFAIHKFMLFPILPDAEYEELFKHLNRLSPRWKENVMAYRRWKDLRNITRNTRKFMMEYRR